MKRYDYIAEVKELIRAMEALKEELLQELDEEPYIKDGDTLYCADYYGEIDEYQAYEDLSNPEEIESAGLHSGNISKSKPFITETEKKVQLTRRLRLFLEMEGYEDWEPDWKNENENEVKWSIGYDHEDKRWYIDSVRFMQQQGTVYFPSQELAKKAIEEVAKPLEREWAK